MDAGEDTAGGRLREIVQRLKDTGQVKSVSDFERRCGISQGALNNTRRKKDGMLSSDTLGRIAKAFPQVDIRWVCTGDDKCVMPGEETLKSLVKENGRLRKKLREIQGICKGL